MKTVLVGFVRLSKSKGALKLNLSVKAIKQCKKYKGKDGEQYIQMIINSQSVNKVLTEKKECTAISHIINE